MEGLCGPVRSHTGLYIAHDESVKPTLFCGLVSARNLRGNNLYGDLSALKDMASLAFV